MSEKEEEGVTDKDWEDGGGIRWTLEGVTARG